MTTRTNPFGQQNKINNPFGQNMPPTQNQTTSNPSTITSTNPPTNKSIKSNVIQEPVKQPPSTNQLNEN